MRKNVLIALPLLIGAPMGASLALATTAVAANVDGSMITAAAQAGTPTSVDVVAALADRSTTLDTSTLTLSSGDNASGSSVTDKGVTLTVAKNGTVDISSIVSAAGDTTFSYSIDDASGTTYVGTIVVTTMPPASDETPMQATPDTYTAKLDSQAFSFVIDVATNDGSGFNPATYKLIDPATNKQVTSYTSAGVTYALADGKLTVSGGAGSASKVTDAHYVTSPNVNSTLVQIKTVIRGEPPKPSAPALVSDTSTLEVGKIISADLASNDDAAGKSMRASYRLVSGEGTTSNAIYKDGIAYSRTAS